MTFGQVGVGLHMRNTQQQQAQMACLKCLQSRRIATSDPPRTVKLVLVLAFQLELLGLAGKACRPRPADVLFLSEVPAQSTARCYP
mmetsp:Transcript_78431/g.229965  ORF Transcript_78431/g.229965 Transcript_78431/m.229965 type:complete len:86 (-) Transcript_78431:144-401(-)